MFQCVLYKAYKNKICILYKIMYFSIKHNKLFTRKIKFVLIYKLHKLSIIGN